MPLRIVTSFYPMYIATLNIAAGISNVTVQNLTQPHTGCLHDYQLTPADMQTLTKADVFVVNGAGMESFLDKAIRQVPGLTVIDASAGLRLLRGAHGLNPHVWVSPSGAIQQVGVIAEGLAQRDPHNADAYRRNAAAYAATLATLRAQMHAELSNIVTRNIITFHEAFDYFADEFGLRVVGVIAQEPGSEPDPRAMADIITLVRQQPHVVLFAEPQYATGAADAIARETGAKLYVLDPVVSGPLTINAYVDIMLRNLRELQRALTQPAQQ
jgi:zinc transport system substrate-binding protein